jgi:microcystin-dependent protein
MSSVIIAGNTSGTITLDAPAVAGTTVLTLPTTSGTILTGSNASLVATGAIQFYAMNTAPSGWLKANGTAISRTTYATLFTAIGTTFGVGDGSTTFNVPDLRGEFARGWDDGRGIDTSRAFGSAQTDAFKSHNHSVNIHTAGSAVYTFLGISSGTAVSSENTQSTGGTETRPRNIALLACIKF